MEKCESEFPDWFHHKVREQKPSSDVLRALSMRPFKRVRTWNQIFVGGFNFHTQSYGKHKYTLNYGVCVSIEDGGEYFGILNDIIELVYTGPEKEYKTILFSCSWMDCGKGMNIHEQYKLVEVNHTKKYPKYDPFVLSYQVSQVYYASYPSLKRDRVQWWVVFRTQARLVIDAPVDLEFLQGPSPQVHATLCPPNDIPDYELDSDDDDDDGFIISSDEEEEESIGSSDSDEEEDIDVFLDDTSDSNNDSDNDSGSSDKSNEEENM
ncbi:uncharacterized protein LOC110702775 [Chenopodium quinoa]|uniref:uncharacterized protein LOC110702775 n=1 Tax=Chenopodium quinoa TaxID=63459 RepID=UPI000B78954E|nr:uncharacterized protein LOC110702775 [Chenopodium quinoa]